MRFFSFVSLFVLAACSGDEPTKKTNNDDTSDVDSDEDGVPDGEDCAPEDPAIYPGADETCNDVDDNCDGEVDNNPIDGNSYYGDADGDGHYGDVDIVQACFIPSGYGFEPMDCDDGNPNIYPGADEGCDLIDTDCDGSLAADELDGDGDGFAACEECDDSRASVHPGADEVCNNRDDDCDGVTDEDASWYPDDDGDGYGDSSASAMLWDCDYPPEGHVDDATDCDDGNSDINPGAPEVCDDFDVDEDCDGLVDDDDDSVTGTQNYAPDADGDGYGDKKAIEAWCNPPSNLIADTSDCDDSDAAIYPGASEVDAGLLEDPACDGGGGSLSMADFQFVGENQSDYAGYSVSSAGDVDGDGLDDIIIGAYGNDYGGSAAGKSYLVLGSTIVASASSDIDLSSADMAFVGETSGDDSGYSVSSAGDVDGDGLSDLLIGAYDNHEGGSDSGQTYLIFGSTITGLLSAEQSILDLSDADFFFIGEYSNDESGRSVSHAGDVDGDGLADVIIGAPRNDDNGSNSGKSYLIFGSTIAASSANDLDLRNADVAFVGDYYDYSGTSVSSAGDVDGDGLDDILIGAPYNEDGDNNAGKTSLVYGSTIVSFASGSTEEQDTGDYDEDDWYYNSDDFDLDNADFSFIGHNSYETSGGDVSSAGDVDGDGLDDILIGFFSSGDEGGSNARSYLVLGSTVAASSSNSLNLNYADVIFSPESSYDSSGRVSGAGDVDGDGLDDIIIGAQYNDDGGSYAGKAYLILGSTLSTNISSSFALSSADFAFTGENSDNYAGSSVSSAGDVNGDGQSDLLIGAYYAGESLWGLWSDDRPGKAYLIYSGL